MKMKLIVIASLATLITMSLAYAQTRSRGLFVSPTSGVAVNSVYGVFIGVTDFEHDDLDLNYAARDAKKLHKLFTNQFKGRVPADHFKLITDEKATRGRILRTLGEVAGLAGRNDMLILFIATHGFPDASGQDLYFYTHDTDPNLPEDRALSRHDIDRVLMKSQTQRVVLLLDACHAGGMNLSGALAMRGQDVATVNLLLSAIGKSRPGRVAITSSSSSERSQESKKFCGGHGAFTCALLTGLKGAADTNRDRLVGARELYDYTYNQVKDLTRGKQHPAISDAPFDEGLPLAALSASSPGGYVAKPTEKVDRLSGGGPQDLSPIAVPNNVGGSVNWDLQDDWADTVAYEEQDHAPTDKKKKWLAFAAKWKTEGDYATKAKDRAKQWGALASAYAKADKAWFAAKKRAGRKRIPIKTRYNAVADILNTAPAGWSYRSEAQGLLEKLRKEKDSPAPEPRVEPTRVTTYPSTPGHASTDRYGIEWVSIPAGSYMMGCSPGDSHCESDEKPRHRESVRAFKMMKTEVTQGMYQSVMGKNPSYFKNCGKDCPVESVNWNDAKAFCGKVGGRLPLEAEWEYAARAGTDTELYTGKLTVKGDNNGPELDPIAWYGGNSGVSYSGGWNCSGLDEKQYSSSRCGTHPVAKKQPNAYGLYDMLGNVLEWTEDCASKKLGGAKNCSARVLRGGCYLGPAGLTRVSGRVGTLLQSTIDYYGFRCSRDEN